MEHIFRFSLLRYAAIIAFGIAIGNPSHGQTPTPSAPMSVTDPSLNDAMARALEPVRQAIGRGDYAAAKTALEAARQQDPNHPGIALYESLIERRQTEGQTIDGQSPLRTPRPGVTPLPAPATTPAPEITPAPQLPPAPGAPAPAVTAEAPAPPAPAADDSLIGKAKGLWENEMVQYAVYGVLALIALLIIFSFFKKRRDRPTETKELEEDETPMATGVTTMGGLDDHLAEEEQQGGFGTFSPGLGGTTTFDPTGIAAPSTGQEETTDFPAPSAGAGAAGASALGASTPEFASFGTDEDEEEEPAPRPKPVARKPVEDDAPVNIFDDEETVVDQPSPRTPAPAPTEAPAEEPSAESLGINMSGEEEPVEQKPFDQEKTVILSAEDEESLAPPVAPAPPSAPVNPTPSSTPSVAPGTVDLEDIFGSQGLPGAESQPPSEPQPQPAEPKAPVEPQEPVTPREPSEPRLEGMEEEHTLRPSSQDTTLSDAPDAAVVGGIAKASDAPEEDANSETLPTFVSTPGAENPEESVEVPPPAQPQRRRAEEGESDSISFEDLFGSPSESSAAPAAEPAPEPEPAPAPEPEPEPAKPAGDFSIEDALAATLGDMQAMAPDAEAPASEPSAAEVAGASSESLDERTERMFSEQLEKARTAFNEKNWRQAVHFLSIASALHPENEEAKQMLKDARAEKRKSEESV